MYSNFVTLLEKISSITTPLLFIVIIIELTFLFIGKRIKLKKESLVSFLSLVIGTIPYLLFYASLELNIMIWFYENISLWTLSNQWYIWLLCFLSYDFLWWAVHYAGHKVRILWCIHGVHHTPKEMNMSVAIRGSLFDFFQYFHILVWLPIIGLNPYMILTVDVISRLYGVFTHINETKFRKTPLLNKLLITPMLHRVHHSSNSIYLDTNFSNVFSIWDRLFNTYQEELDTIKPIYGITESESKSINTENVFSSQFGLLKDLFHDIRSTPSIKNKIKFLFMPPDWKPSSSARKNTYQHQI
ncbi:Sterol desaturase/sphingolipid hydroxylase, fatty acid hydroxylase superfamily [Tenacibaculum sp. MAR_2010_89]|uniref:sterol desaturase family protein n=1 Tax=Tenacibaculum sp. MAR_2010_89 TaxID=1250198 RepID=UPI000898B02B|nr:sterol desaturase family protein [Tenacibaculum sp. MAR_2010_89]SED66838.1 Sterol desaturase/sphingolipid hydroxylase, fatty acid hydroxylase superfamily [Tenacibaculum sp. MAR_2010_89]